MSSNAVATRIRYPNLRGSMVDQGRLRGPRVKTKSQATELVSLADVERQHILKVYAILEYNKTQTARVLEIDIKTLYNRLRRYGFHP
ncbi:MAG: hypothetical protein IID37_03760 [Planctomycetes bacterium]|nr:hypothetical protein [Planctomycetota bacterium]